MFSESEIDIMKIAQCPRRLSACGIVVLMILPTAASWLQDPHGHGLRAREAFLSGKSSVCIKRICVERRKSFKKEKPRARYPRRVPIAEKNAKFSVSSR